MVPGTRGTEQLGVRPVYQMVAFLNPLRESDITRTVVDVLKEKIGTLEFADRTLTERISDSGLPSYQTRTV